LAYNAAMLKKAFACLPLLGLCLGLLVVTSGFALAAGQTAPDLIFHNANIILIDPENSTASAVAITGREIAAVGSDDDVLKLKTSRTRVVDLKGMTIIPGLIDAHGHVAGLGFALTRVDAVGTDSAEAVAARVRQAADLVAPGEWIRGRGWDQNDWDEKDFPDHKLLDEAAPRNPVALSRVDGHAIWTNKKAMDIAGVNRKTPDPAGGRIHRDAEGHPTGIFVDNAESLITSNIIAPDRNRLRQAILRGLNRCLDSGLTSVHDAGISFDEASIYMELAASGELPIRVYAMLGGNSRTFQNYFESAPLVGAGDGFLSIRSIKLGIDGALGSRGAALDADYSDEAGNRGLITLNPEEIRAIAAQAAAKGYQVAVHAIGDRGNRLALDALEAALKTEPGKDHRFRVEHAQILHVQDIPRFKALGILPSMQPTHCTSDMPWAVDRLGQERLAGAYAWRKLLQTGAIIPAGSDFPVESENPFLGLYAAVTRQDLAGKPEGGWRPEEKLTREEALRAFTLHAAYASFDEKLIGSITPGKRADMVILAGNLMKVPASDLAKMKPEGVLVDGKVVRSSARLKAVMSAGMKTGGTHDKGNQD
jgi:predicted amidohydrolase YtcJ